MENQDHNNVNQNELTTPPISPGIQPQQPLDVPAIDPLPEPESKSELLCHPIFQFESSGFFSAALKNAQAVLSPTPPPADVKYKEILEEIHTTVFGSRATEQLHEEFAEFELPQNTMCGKAIEGDEVYFRCLDCDVMTDPSIQALQCSQCFGNSNHEGHRVLYYGTGNFGAFCDCGDPNSLNPRAFCPSHKLEELDSKAILEMFPKNILDQFQSTLKKALYIIFSLYEMARKTDDKNIRKGITNLANQLLDHTLEFCTRCYTEIDQSFLYLISTVLQENLQDPYDQLWHNCDDLLNEEDPKTVKTDQAHPCKCSIAANLLRLGVVFSVDRQTAISNLTRECLKDNSFQRFYILEISKHAHFLYSRKYYSLKEEDNENSKLLSIVFQLFLRGDLLQTVIKAGYYKNYLQIMKKSISESLQPSAGIQNIILRLVEALIPFLRYDIPTASIMILETEFLKEMLSAILTLQLTFTCAGDMPTVLENDSLEYKVINNGLLVEGRICDLLDMALDYLYRFPGDQASRAIKEFVAQIYSSLDLVNINIEPEIPKGLISIHPALERLFCVLARRSSEDLSYNSIEAFCKEVLLNESLCKISEKTSAGVLRSLGIMRYLQILHNYEYGSIYIVYYYQGGFGFFETDTLLIQLAAMIGNPEQLFEQITRSFFSYSAEMQGFFKDLEAIKTRKRSKLMGMRDFLNFLIFIMTDEISLLNLRMKDKSVSFKSLDLNPAQKKLVEKVIINILVGHYSTEAATVKKQVHRMIKEHPCIDELIQKVTVLDQDTHKIRLKEGCEKEFDPYLLYKLPALQQKSNNTFMSKMNNSTEVDLLFGKYNPSCPEYLKRIQQNLFTSSLPDFLSSYIKGVHQEIVSFMQPVLKLILLNLQVAEELVKKDPQIPMTVSLVKKIRGKYINEDFTTALGKIILMEECKDYEQCIKTIQTLLVQFLEQKEESPMLIDTSLSRTSSISEEEKKRIAKEKMQKLKEEFAKRRSLFATQNSSALTQEAELEESKLSDLPQSAQAIREDLTCQLCLESIREETDEYGIPVYISFTNNLYDTAKDKIDFKEQDWSDLPKVQWWPVASSCNHYYHQACFRSLNSKAPNKKIEKPFSNMHETACLLCKSLSNLFLPLTNAKIRDQVSAEDEINQRLSTPSLPKEIQLILGNMASRLTVLSLKTSKQTNIFPYDICLRGYTYFVETLGIYEQMQTAEKCATLYTNLFRAIRRDLRGASSREKVTDNFSLFRKLQEGTSDLETQTHMLIQYQPEALVDELFFAILINFPTEQYTPKQIGGALAEAQLSIIKEYLVFKLVQLVYFEDKEKGCYSKTLVEVLEYFRSSGSLQEKMAKELAPALQKFATAYILNASVVENTSISGSSTKILTKNTDSETDYINELLNLIDSPHSFKYLIVEGLSEHIAAPKDSFISNLIATIQSKDLENCLVKPKVVRLAPRIVSLPPDLIKFSDKYYLRRCSLCNKHGYYLRLCLICNEVMCVQYCGASRGLNSVGNLNIHAIKYHMGLGIFTGYQVSQVSLISAPINAKKVISHYIDALGQTINHYIYEDKSILDCIDFKRFALNEEFVQYVRSVINNHSMGREAFMIMKSGNGDDQLGSL